MVLEPLPHKLTGGYLPYSQDKAAHRDAAEPCPRTVGGHAAILDRLELNRCLLIFSRSICPGIDARWLTAKQSHSTEAKHVLQPQGLFAFICLLQALKGSLLSPGEVAAASKHSSWRS